MTQQPFDVKYWGQFGQPAKIDLSRWGPTCKRGCAYKNVGPTTDGAPNQRRSISSGRKARGYSSGDPRKDEA